MDGNWDDASRAIVMNYSLRCVSNQSILMTLRLILSRGRLIGIASTDAQEHPKHMRPLPCKSAFQTTEATFIIPTVHFPRSKRCARSRGLPAERMHHSSTCAANTMSSVSPRLGFGTSICKTGLLIMLPASFIEYRPIRCSF